jgi:hypothetical protein
MVLGRRSIFLIPFCTLEEAHVPTLQLYLRTVVPSERKELLTHEESALWGQVLLTSFSS